MNRKGLLAGSVLALAAWVGGANGVAVAQDSSDAPGQLWLVHQEIAKPSMLQQWNSTTLEVMQLAAKVGAPTMTRSIVLEGEDLTFSFAVPLKSFNDITGVSQDFDLMAKKEPKAFADLMQRGWAPVESSREFFLRERTDLSYRPEHSSLKPEDMRFYRYDTYAVMPGKEDEAMAIAREFAALYKAKGVTRPYRVFWVESGPDMPALVVESPAKDGADYYTELAAERAQLGEEGKALFARAYAISRRIQHNNAWLRPDLSPSLWIKK